MSRDVSPDVDTLTGLFYAQPEQLGRFAEATSDSLPEVHRALLDHEHHMTVTVETHYGSPVDVRVLDKVLTPTHYARKILLVSQANGAVVQFGIMRVNLAYLSEPVRREIESEKTPLGRVLIKHNVLRKVHLVQLWRVTPGPDLRQYFGLTDESVTYGRTALIECDGEPAVELLEIVRPA